MKSRKSFLLRIDPRLYEELEVWAAAELRSVNAQVEFLLKDCVNRRRKILFAEGGEASGQLPSDEERQKDSN
jgi:hypothetical protein